jgi:hypothetical protein
MNAQAVVNILELFQGGCEDSDAWAPLINFARKPTREGAAFYHELYLELTNNYGVDGDDEKMKKYLGTVASFFDSLIVDAEIMKCNSCKDMLDVSESYDGSICVACAYRTCIVCGKRGYYDLDDFGYLGDGDACGDCCH